MQRSLALALVLVAALAGGGCKKPDPAKHDEPAAAGSTADLSSDRSMQVMNLYVELFNDLIKDVPSPMSNYFDRATENGLALEEMTKWGNVICAGAGWMKMSRDGARKQAAEAKRSSSGEFAKMPPLAEAMLTTGVAYADTRDEVCKYIKSGDFKKDQGGRAKELHGKVLAAREAWNAAVGALGSELDRVEDAQTQAELKKHEADQSYGYWFRLTTMRANELLRVVRRDAAKIEASVAPFTDAVAGAQAFAATKGAKVNQSFAGYLKQVERMTKAVAALQKSLASAKTPAAKQLVVDKAFDDLVGIYNTMISLHNTLIGAEGRGDLR